MSSSGKYDFTGKVALVTGSSTGIGASIATQLAKYGANVAITGRDPEALAKVSAEIESISGQKPLEIIGDLSDDSMPQKLVDETVEKFGSLDFLINNAGLWSLTGYLENPACLEEFDKLFKVNVRSVIQLTQLAMPELEKTKGNIVNVSSVLGLRSYRNMLVYCTTKAALDMVTKNAALELGPKGIRVNSVNPGPVATDLYRDAENSSALIESFAASTIMNRVAVPEEITNLVSFLVSDEAVNITGSIMVNDAGMAIK